MRVLMLSWEYPPETVGGIAPHVHDLALALSGKGQEVTVLTRSKDPKGTTEQREGVRICRMGRSAPEPPDFVSWVMQLNLQLMEKAVSLVEEGEAFDLIHAHDWLVAYAGKALKHAFRLPLIATIHATEWGRNNGLHNELQRYISNVEWWLAYEAWRVICCSRYMCGELQRIFQVPANKMRVIPNGVYPELFRPPAGDARAIRRQYAADDEQVVFYVGRLVFEKGLDLLLEAARKVLAHREKVKFIIAGKGPHAGHLHHRARQTGLYHKFYFTGYVDDLTRNALFSTADVAVFPSLYEPFGIVALEAMAAGTPVVVADTGGLGEVVQHGKNGLKAFPNNPESLADNILWVLTHPEEAAALRDQARRDLETEYNWGKIAEQTIDLYREVQSEYQRSDWHRQVAGAARALARDRRIRPGAATAGATGAGRYTPAQTATGWPPPAFNGQKEGYQ
ncbi:MAG: glycosyltransferase family 4 protein [Firmicutes bacterium]|nr:glycosyltransferase family 4 protein [Bacillota bacterium]